MTTAVLLSGGMDSAVALAWALANRRDVMAISLDYEQPHRRELVAAKEIAADAGVPWLHHDLRIPWAPGRGPVIPGRNTIMLTIAASHAVGRTPKGETASVVIGACRADALGFPDCRPEFLLAAQTALSLGLGEPVEIVAPFIDRTKAQIVQTARALGAWSSLARSWSCYVGGELPCGDCGACRFRIDGFREAGEVDPWSP